MTKQEMADVIAYRMRKESFVNKAAETVLPTPFGEFRAMAFANDIDEYEHLALVKGEIDAEQEVLVDKPGVVSGVVRVTGPFTVEGVMPEELNIGEEGLFDGTPDEDLDHAEIGDERVVEMQNLHAYLSSMVAHRDPA